MEQQNKKLLLHFQGEMLRFGTVMGFKHFSMTLQGREEMVLKIKTSSKTNPESSFLLAAYARYNSPYVWLRSDDKVLLKMTGTRNIDSPLNLQSIYNWRNGNIHPWDVISELVQFCHNTTDMNPFAIHINHFHSMKTKSHLYLSTAAMINCLQKILLASPPNAQYAQHISKDIFRLIKLHFQELKILAQKESIPILEQYKDSQASRPSKTLPWQSNYSSSPSKLSYPLSVRQSKQSWS